MKRGWRQLRGNVVLRWQAYELGSVNHLGRFSRLAHALEKSASAEQQNEGTLLHYVDGWSDETLSEQLISAPNSVEHLLVLQEPPQVNNNSQYLEMRAKLNLLPNMTIWVDGEQQNGRFQTENAIEIRSEEGDASLLLDPVLAFEVANPATSVAGEYVVLAFRRYRRRMAHCVAHPYLMVARSGARLSRCD